MSQVLIEEPTPTYNLLPAPPYRVFRAHTGSSIRMYYTKNEAGEINLYLNSSFVTEQSQTVKESQGLINWIANKGVEESKEYMNIRAEYGTFMHILFASLLINGKMDFSAMWRALVQYCENPVFHNKDIDWVDELKSPDGFMGASTFHPLADKWYDDLKSDVLSFTKFIIDHKVKPLAIETLLKSDSMGVATPIDLICEMTVYEMGDHGVKYKTSGKNFKKGDTRITKGPVQVSAIVDFKSGRKGFYKQHALQLEMGRRIVKENYEYLFNKTDFRLFNFAPSDWKTEIGFKLKDQTNNRDIEEFDSVLKLAKIRDRKRLIKRRYISGVVDIESIKSGEKTLEGHVQELDLVDFINRNIVVRDDEK